MVIDPFRHLKEVVKSPKAMLGLAEYGPVFLKLDQAWKMIGSA